MQQLDDRIAAAEGIQGGEPDDASKGGFGSPQSVVAEAKKHLGYRETGENDTKFNRWLKIKGYPHGFGYPWCHASAVRPGPLRQRRRRAAHGGVRSRRGWFKQRNRFVPSPASATSSTTGRTAARTSSWSSALGPARSRRSNTSGSVGGQQFFNGDGVYQKSVQRTSRIFGYGRPAYAAGGALAGGGGGAAAAATAAKPMTTVRSIAQQQEAVNALGFTPKLTSTASNEDRSRRQVAPEEDRRRRRRRMGQATERLFKAQKKQRSTSRTTEAEGPRADVLRPSPTAD